MYGVHGVCCLRVSYASFSYYDDNLSFSPSIEIRFYTNNIGKTANALIYPVTEVEIYTLYIYIYYKRNFEI